MLRAAIDWGRFQARRSVEEGRFIDLGSRSDRAMKRSVIAEFIATKSSPSRGVSGDE